MQPRNVGWCKPWADEDQGVLPAICCLAPHPAYCPAELHAAVGALQRTESRSLVETGPQVQAIQAVIEAVQAVHALGPAGAALEAAAALEAYRCGCSANLISHFPCAPSCCLTGADTAIPGSRAVLYAHDLLHACAAPLS
jgi:hypothetical protein